MVAMIDRIESLYEIDDDGCFIFTGPRTRDGYGLIQIRGEDGKIKRGPRRLVHRVVYERVVGQVSDGMVLDHICRNRPCVNPDHLEEVTQLENVQRGARKNLTHCPEGHPLSGDNLYETKEGWRHCRACRAAADRRYQDRKRNFGPSEAADTPTGSAAARSGESVASDGPDTQHDSPDVADLLAGAGPSDTQMDLGEAA